MSRGFFSYFPTVKWNDQIVTNILAKLRFDETVSKNLSVFYPHTVEEGERPDHIAKYYYGDPYYDWIIYFSNNINDPYHEWPKSQDVFDDFITAKFGSVANSQSAIAYYRNNFEADDSVLTSPAYSALASEQKSFWMPIDSENGETIGYERKNAEIILETNIIVAATVANTFPPVEGSIITQNLARGTVGFSNASTIVLKHISGTFANGISSAGTITNVTTISQPLGATISTYFTPVTFYEHEENLNESRKHIRLLSPAYVEIVERNLRDLLRA